MGESDEAMEEANFQFCNGSPHAFLIFVEGQEFLFHGSAKLCKIASPECSPCGNKHFGASLDENTLIHCDEEFALSLGFIRQDARHEGGHAVESVWQESERSFGGLCDNV